jgi:hypothetical protein
MLVIEKLSPFRIRVEIRIRNLILYPDPDPNMKIISDLSGLRSTKLTMFCCGLDISYC